MQAFLTEVLKGNSSKDTNDTITSTVDLVQKNHILNIKNKK